MIYMVFEGQVSATEHDQQAKDRPHRALQGWGQSKTPTGNVTDRQICSGVFTLTPVTLQDVVSYLGKLSQGSYQDAFDPKNS
jgi:hypothetical protein